MPVIRISRAAIVSRFEAGMTVAEAAEALGIRKGRLYQLVARLGIPLPVRADARTLPPTDELVGMLSEGITPAAIGLQFGTTKQAVYMALHRVGLTCRAGAVVEMQPRDPKPAAPFLAWPNFGDAA